MPYIPVMHSVIWTATFTVQAKRCGLSGDEVTAIVNTLALDPLAGDTIAGTGGARNCVMKNRRCLPGQYQGTDPEVSHRAMKEIEPAGVSVPEAMDVAAIRKKLRLSQAAFAERYGLPVSTLRDWEQNRRSPDRAALVLMALIDRNPQMVADTLAAS